MVPMLRHMTVPHASIWSVTMAMQHIKTMHNALWMYTVQWFLLLLCAIARLKRSFSSVCLFPLDVNELQCKPSSKEAKTSIRLPYSPLHLATILAKSLLRSHVTCTTLVQLPVRIASPVSLCVYATMYATVVQSTYRMRFNYHGVYRDEGS